MPVAMPALHAYLLQIEVVIALVAARGQLVYGRLLNGHSGACTFCW